MCSRLNRFSDKLKKSLRISCRQYGQQLTDNTRELYTYLSALSHGGLLVATDDLMVTLARCRNVFKQLVLRDDFLREGDQLEELMECATLQLAAEHDALFSCHEVHREDAPRDKNVDLL